MTLYEFDRAILSEGYALICGVDEAGRGPLAGAVFASAVTLPYDVVIDGLNDSKKLSAKRREELFEEITRSVLDYCIASADAWEIDSVNILQASFLAMRRAVEGLSLPSNLVLVDGNADPRLHLPTRTIVKGDSKSACISAASILAKVARDRYMADLDKEYPQYMFSKHKGYPTKLHYQMLDEYGPCPEHRESFLRSWRQKNK